MTSPPHAVPAVEAVELRKVHGALTAVDGISMRVEQGEVYGVLGPNGAGKTTFLRMLVGLIRPCWTAGGPSTLIGLATITDAHGRDVTNPVAEFDGCFDPTS